MGEEIIHRFLKQEVSPKGAFPFSTPKGKGGDGSRDRVQGPLLATEPPLCSLGIPVVPTWDQVWEVGAMQPGQGSESSCSPWQSPEFLPEVGQPHASRCLQDLQKSPCKDLFSSCLW